MDEDVRSTRLCTVRYLMALFEMVSLRFIDRYRDYVGLWMLGLLRLHEIMRFVLQYMNTYSMVY